MTKQDFDNIQSELEYEFQRHDQVYGAIDMSDVGNIIASVVAKYFDEGNMGYEEEDFMSGIQHGISLVDGSHG